MENCTRELGSEFPYYRLLFQDWRFVLWMFSFVQFPFIFSILKPTYFNVHRHNHYHYIHRKYYNNYLYIHLYVPPILNHSEYMNACLYVVMCVFLFIYDSLQCFSDMSLKCGKKRWLFYSAREIITGKISIELSQCKEYLQPAMQERWIITNIIRDDIMEKKMPGKLLHKRIGKFNNVPIDLWSMCYIWKWKLFNSLPLIYSVFLYLYKIFNIRTTV